MHKVRLRNAVPEDAQHLARIHRSARAAAMPWLPVLHSPEEDIRFFAQQVLPSHSVHIAACGNAIAGFIAVDQDWINHLYISPDHWRQGIGTVLLRHAMRGSTVLRLWTFQRNNAARAFYTGHSFKEVGCTDGADNEERTPDVRMEWTRDARPPS
ncbi:N-acetyltransferase family protein [Hoeflea sp.]|uniref:GNAT family N-acetyltransferase n=1 Tax=Hoeflea sp. TaxID=1940281 RepID=UPI003B025041